MVRRCTAVLLLALIAMPVLPATLDGNPPVPLPLFPGNNWWNVDVSNAPPVADPTIYHGQMGGLTRRMHPDFGATDLDNGPPYTYGIPFIVVDGAQAKKIVDFIDYPSQSDGVGVPFYPIPDEAITTAGWVEEGPAGNVDRRAQSDRHLLMLDGTNNHLYELYNVWYNGTQWEAASGAFFDMNTNNRRTEGDTSADASGMAILPGLVRYDEVFGPDEIRHAFRVTFSSTNGYVFPASHVAGSTSNALPMGARLRLKASTNISSFSAPMQKILRAMKRYGLIVADNGSNLFVTGTHDPRWDMDLFVSPFHSLHVSDFEIIQLGWKPAIAFVLTLPANVGKGDASSGTLTAYDQNLNVATGYTGTVQFTSTDGSATLPANYTFTGGDAGVHTFPAGFTFQTSGSQVVTITDTVTTSNTGSRGIAVGPATPTGVAATASSTAQVNVTWNNASGATQFQVWRGNSLLTTTGLLNFTDNTVSAGTSYVYKVRALDAASRPSSYSTPDVATTIVFTDDPVVAATTAIKATHVTQLRTAVNAMRTAAGLGAASFTDVSLAGVKVKAVHIQELRTALAAARSVFGLPSTFTDPTLTATTSTVRGVHVQELRAGVK